MLIFNRRRGSAPVGQPFRYTDATELGGNFKKSGRRWHWKLFRRIPVGWLMTEDDAKTTFIAPVYDDNIILTAGEFDQKDE